MATPAAGGKKGVGTNAADSTALPSRVRTIEHETRTGFDNMPFLSSVTPVARGCVPGRLMYERERKLRRDLIRLPESIGS